jgi:hypothetical protein
VAGRADGSSLTGLNSEKKIDLIEERLGGVEETLQRLGGIEQALRELLISSRQHGAGSTAKFSASSLSSPDTLAQTQSSTSKQDHAESKAPGYTSNAAIEQHDSGSAFEGNSSLAAHSAYAKEFLESAVSHSTPEMFSSPKINEALSSLKQIVEMQSKQRDAGTQRGQLSSRLGARCDIRELEMPPLPVVLTVLKKAKGMTKSLMKSGILDADQMQRTRPPRLGAISLFSRWTISSRGVRKSTSRQRITPMRHSS